MRAKTLGAESTIGNIKSWRSEIAKALKKDREARSGEDHIELIRGMVLHGDKISTSTEINKNHRDVVADIMQQL